MRSSGKQPKHPPNQHRNQKGRSIDRPPSSSIDATHPPLSPWEIIGSLISILSVLLGLNLARICCQWALHPLFGSIGSNLNLEFWIQAIDFLIVPSMSLLLPSLVPSMSAACFLAALLVWRSPDSFGRILADYSGRVGNLRGPSIFQFLAYWPIRVTGVAAAQAFTLGFLRNGTRFRSLENRQTFRIIRAMSLPLVLHVISRSMLPLAKLMLNSLPTCRIFDLTAAFLLGIAVIGTLLKRKMLATPVAKNVNRFIILGSIMCLILQPTPRPLCHEPDDWEMKAFSEANYQPIARGLSTTGMILVGELTHESGSQFRFLRCDHSLLGGIWIGIARKEILNRSAQSSHALSREDVENQAIHAAETIYPTFILQSAVRLVRRTQNDNASTKAGSKALIIGLGVGTVARALLKHDITLTIVEIDPLVFEYSQKYFGLPKLVGEVFLEDARAYLGRKEPWKSQRFDYVIHDVFTGGSVPSSLFTLECWRAIRAKLKDDGVLAVNFVGAPTSDVAGMVLKTLFKVFPHCRAFSENPALAPTEYQNMVIFCSPARKPEFRELLQEDHSILSPYQFEVLGSIDTREIDVISILSNQTDDSLVVTDGNRSKLDQAQVADGLNHWGIMRKSLPEEVWNHYYF